MRKYNYVVLGSASDLYMFSYSDLFSESDVKYIPDIKCLLKKTYSLYRLHNRLFVKYGVGGLTFWNRFLKIEEFEEKRPLCFVYMWSWVCFNDKTKIVEHFKNKYPESKHVLFMQDITYSFDPKHETYKPEDFSKDFDIIYSFDPGDCEKYGFTYHPLVFSSYKKHGLPIIYDVYMLALAKNRLEAIYEMYNLLISHGLSLCFILVGVPEGKRINKPGIVYMDHVSYEKNLLFIEQSRCLLEIMQKNGIGYTQRGCEAVCLGKKLLTNNSYISNEPFYNSKFISVYSKENGVDEVFLNKIKDDEDVDYGVDNRMAMSPIKLLDQIETRLRNSGIN